MFHNNLFRLLYIFQYVLTKAIEHHCNLYPNRLTLRVKFAVTNTVNNAGSRYAINLYLCFALLGIGLLVIGYGIDMYSPSYSWRNVDYSPSDPVIPLEIFICAGVAIILYSLPAFIILMKKCFNCKNYSYYMTATEFCEQCSNTVKHIPLDKIKYVTKDKQTFNGYSYPVIKIGTSDKEILVEYIGSINRSIKIISETMSKM